MQQSLNQRPLRKRVAFVSTNSNTIITLVQLDPTFFVKALRLSKKWREDVIQGIDDFCNPIENKFVSTYFEHIYFKRGFTWSKPITFCGKKGLRLDRVFECEVIPDGKFELF
jgi:hypothetical protein